MQHIPFLILDASFLQNTKKNPWSWLINSIVSKGLSYNKTDLFYFFTGSLTQKSLCHDCISKIAFGTQLQNTIVMIQELTSQHKVKHFTEFCCTNFKPTSLHVHYAKCEFKFSINWTWTFYSECLYINFVTHYKTVNSLFYFWTQHES